MVVPPLRRLARVLRYCRCPKKLCMHLCAFTTPFVCTSPYRLWWRGRNLHNTVFCMPNEKTHAYGVVFVVASIARVSSLFRSVAVTGRTSTACFYCYCALWAQSLCDGRVKRHKTVVLRGAEAAVWITTIGYTTSLVCVLCLLRRAQGKILFKPPSVFHCFFLSVVVGFHRECA